MDGEGGGVGSEERERWGIKEGSDEKRDGKRIGVRRVRMSET